MPRLIRNRHSEDEKGQSLVEFALIIPLFLILVFAMVDFGMGFHAWITITNASREGARIGVVGADSAAIESRVREAATSLNDDNLDVTVINAPPDGAAGEEVTVQVSYDYHLITPLSSLLGMVSGNTLGPTIDFQSEANMRIE